MIINEHSKMMEAWPNDELTINMCDGVREYVLFNYDGRIGIFHRPCGTHKYYNLDLSLYWIIVYQRHCCLRRFNIDLMRYMKEFLY
jgi:hypothetical protein